jgi:hypothetical protein
MTRSCPHLVHEGHHIRGGLTLGRSASVLGRSLAIVTDGICVEKQRRQVGRWSYVFITVLATTLAVLAPSVYSPLGAVSPNTAWYIPWSSVVTSKRSVYP